MRNSLVLLAALGTIAWPGSGFAQEPPKETAADGLPKQLKKAGQIRFKQDIFTFVRVKFSPNSKLRRYRSATGAWATDYPGADLNFATRFQEVTGMKVNTNGAVLSLTDPNLNDYPFIYIAEGGQMHLQPEEIMALRNYLLGGGFLMVDDFWGQGEWESLAREMHRVCPERDPVDLPLTHEIFRCLYEIKEKPQVPNVMTGIESEKTGITWERWDAKEAHYRGLFDDKGRLMAVYCHNTDLGDGWERSGTSEYYDREFSFKKAYPMGINIVVYALTH